MIQVLSPTHSLSVAGQSGDALSSQPHLLVFELGYTGHYPAYIQHLMRYWCDQQPSGTLQFVVSPGFCHQHPEVVELAQRAPNRDRSHLMLTCISPAEAAGLSARRSPIHRARRSLQEWRLVQRYVTRFQATHCLLLYFDSFQTAIGGRRSLPCPFSGIYFRPMLHYGQRDGAIPWPAASGVASAIRQRRERLMLPLILRHPQLHHLFCLDPFAIEPLQNLVSHPTGDRPPAIHFLPDPVARSPHQTALDRQSFRQALGFAADRRVFLLFGALYDRRKGLRPVLTALSQLERSQQQQIGLLLVGQLHRQTQPDLEQQLTQLVQTTPIQLVIWDDYVPAETVFQYFQAADIVLAPYQRHVGMSGILVQAAAVQTPVLAPDYGLMGALVQRHQLGITLNTTDPTALAAGFRHCLVRSVADLGDRTRMQAFAAQHTAEGFAETIIQTLLTGNSRSLSASL